MPEYFSQQAAQEPRHRVVCDYIAGMTDHFLLRQHGEFIGSGSAAARR
jgi:dGTP triphosphohydrolase